MAASNASWRVVLPFVAAGLVLLIVSIALVVHDMVSVRSDAESEMLALAEAGAVALEFTSAEKRELHLSSLLKHPAVSTATVYSSNGEQRRAEPPVEPRSSFTRLLARASGPVTACRETGSGTLCIDSDPAYYSKRLGDLLVPHGILMASASALLIASIVLAKGSSRRELAEMTRIVSGAAGEGNYALRAVEGKGPAGQLGEAINRLLEQMHQRDLVLRRRTTELESANRELEAFTYSVSHDLRSPVASIDGFSKALEEMYGDQLDEGGRECIGWIRQAVEQMKDLISGLLQMSRISRSELAHGEVDLSAVARSIVQTLRQREPERSVDVQIEDGLTVEGDERLLHAVMENLLSNAFKFTRKREQATIAVGAQREGSKRTLFVRDNGAGFDSAHAARMFTAFQRLHSQSEFEGTGIGLATVKKIIERHGGTIWAEGDVDRGATFYFTIGENFGAGQERR